jgi:hypothetical protein
VIWHSHVDNVFCNPWELELATFVVETSSNWREDAGNVLASYHVHVPLHACASSAEEQAIVFLAPSATAGTLIASGHSDTLVAAISPWTTESEHEEKKMSSVQLTSCIARYMKYVENGSSSAGIGSDQQFGGSWICVHGPHQRDFNDSAYELTADCAPSSTDGGVGMICQASVHLMVTEARIPQWATSQLSVIRWPVANPDCVYKQVLRLRRLTCGWTTAVALRISSVG